MLKALPFRITVEAKSEVGVTNVHRCLSRSSKFTSCSRAARLLLWKPITELRLMASAMIWSIALKNQTMNGTAKTKSSVGTDSLYSLHRASSRRRALLRQWLNRAYIVVSVSFCRMLMPWSFALQICTQKGLETSMTWIPLHSNICVDATLASIYSAAFAI